MKSLQQARHPRLANQASPLQDRQLWDPSGGRGDRPSEVRGLGYLKGAAELGSCGPLLSHALLREQAVCGMPGPRTKLPNHGYLQNRPAVGGVGFPSKSQSPVRPLDQRETPVGEGSWDLLEADEGLVGTEGPHQCRHPRITDGIALQAANRARYAWGGHPRTHREPLLQPGDCRCQVQQSWGTPGAVATPHCSAHHTSFPSPSPTFQTL